MATPTENQDQDQVEFYEQPHGGHIIAVIRGTAMILCVSWRTVYRPEDTARH
jgi:hypothetical protein